MPPPGGDGLEHSIPRWPPAGPIEPIASLLAQGINRVLVTGVRCAIYQGIRGITGSDLGLGGGGAQPFSAPAMAAFTPFPVFLQQRDHISDSPGVAFGGVELVPELDKIALSLLLSSSSRSSFFSSRFRLGSSSYSRCSIPYRCTFSSTVGCQLLLLHGRRHGGNDARNSCLLR